MNYLAAQNFCLKVIKWSTFLILFVPLLVTSSTLFPYVFGKAVAFQVLVEIMLISYLWLLYFNFKQTDVKHHPDPILNTEEGSYLFSYYNYLPKLNLLFWALIIFFIILVLSTIFSVDPSYSFWSKQERMDGLFNLLHFFIFFVILSGVFKDKKAWLQILDVSIIASFLVTLHAFGQKIGLFFAPYGERVTGPLGNASFLATYLLFNIFFALILFSQRKNIWSKIWYLIVLFLEVSILFFTLTRGAIFGLLAGFLIFLFGYTIFAQPGRWKKYALFLLLIIFLFGGILFFARHSDFVKKNPVLNRLTDISFETGTGKTRLISWRIGLNAFLERPLFGWGQENYYVAFNKHLDPIFYTFSSETFDRAHNKIIDLLVMNGILGLLAYLFIFFAALLVLWSRRKENFIISLILISLLGAYFVQNLLLFDMPVSYLMFFLFLGLVSFVTKKNQERAIYSEQESKFFLKYFVWLLTFIIIFTFWWGNLKPLLASQKSIDGQGILMGPIKNDTAFQLAIEDFKKSINYQTFTNPETRKALSQTILMKINQSEYSSQLKLEGLKFTASEIEQGLKEKPLFIEYYLALGNVYNALGVQDSSYFSKGQEILKQAIDIYPNVPQIYQNLTVNRILAEDLNQARESAQKALQLNPKLPISHWYLSIIYFYASDFNQAKESAEKAIELGYGYRTFNNLFYLSQLYDKLNDYQKSVLFYQDLAELYPQDFLAQFNLAQVFQRSGQKEKARALAEKLLETWPQNASTIEEFIKGLK